MLRLRAVRAVAWAGVLSTAAVPLVSASSPPPADCSSNRYTIDGLLASSAAFTPACVQPLSSLSSSSGFFFAHQLLLIAFWSLLLLASVLLSCRVYATRSGLFKLTWSNDYKLALLLLLLVTPAASLLYNAIGPLASSSALSPAVSAFWLFAPDVVLVASFSLLYPYARDLLLLSPVISDAQYNSFVQSKLPRVLVSVGLATVSALLIAAAVSGRAGVLLAFLCVALAYVAVFGACWLWRLYGLAARDVKAVRRISVATLPAAAKPAVDSAAAARADNSWMQSSEVGTGSTRLEHTSSISAASGKMHSSLSGMERPATATRTQPNESPKSASASNSLAPPSAQHSFPAPAVVAAPSSHSISISPFATASASSGGGQAARRVSIVVAVEAGCKPVKTFAAERVNVRRLMALHCAMAVAFAVVYAVHIALLASSSSHPAATVIALHLARGLVAIAWSLLFVWTLWPSKQQLQKARDKQERRNSIRRASLLPVSTTMPAPAADTSVSVQAGKGLSPPLAPKQAEAVVDALGLAVNEQVSEAMAEMDDEDDVESSRQRALVLMSAAAHYMQQQHSSHAGTPVHGASASPTSSPFAHSAFATHHPPPPILALSAADPTSLLEPAALPNALPVPTSAAAAAFAATSSARVRHSLPAIHVEPLLLRSLVQALTEPTTPVNADPASVLSPPGMLREFPPPMSLDRRVSEGNPLPAVGASSRAVAAARPTSASQTSARSHSSLGSTTAGASGKHQRERSRAESIRKDAISPRAHSRGSSSRQRIFTPVSAHHTNAVDG